MAAYVCDECGKSFSQKRSLIKHIRIHHRQKIAAAAENEQNKNFRCSLCRPQWQDFPSQLELNQHIQGTHKRKRFRCTVCSFSTKHKHSLKAHDANKHRPEYKQHRCGHCKTSFVWKSGLLRHKRRHAGQFPVICTKCGKGFESGRDLKRHLPVHDKKSAKKQGGVVFKCGQCPDVFAQGIYLEEHMAKKHQKKANKKFSCDTCDFSTNCKGSLQRHKKEKHLKNHQKLERPVLRKKKSFPCDQCTKSFTRPSHLGLHIQSVHLKEKPHKCGECGKCFARKSDLTEHQEREKGEKVPCPCCGLQLANKPSLQNHLREMHGDQPMYRCGLCGQGLSTMGNLKRHEVKQHLEKPIFID